MTTTIKAIETRYAGCRFRSRLEARWARFFDHLSIEWEYEPQGYEVSHRITGGWDFEKKFNYLPDFWLPGYEMWAEVKGSLTREEVARLYDAAASLSSNDGEGCHDSGGHDLVLLGSLTKGMRYGNPVRLHMHKGDLLATCFWCGPHDNYVIVGDDSGTIDYSATQRLLAGFSCREHGVNPAFLMALDVARSARFEFGARG